MTSVLPGLMGAHAAREGVETLLALTPATAIQATDLSTVGLVQVRQFYLLASY